MAIRYRLRTLLLLLMIGPPVLALALVYADRPYMAYVRWLSRPAADKGKIKGSYSAPGPKEAAPAIRAARTLASIAAVLMYLSWVVFVANQWWQSQTRGGERAVELPRGSHRDSGGPT